MVSSASKECCVLFDLVRASHIAMAPAWWGQTRCMRWCICPFSSKKHSIQRSLWHYLMNPFKKHIIENVVEKRKSLLCSRRDIYKAILPMPRGLLLWTKNTGDSMEERIEISQMVAVWWSSMQQSLSGAFLGYSEREKSAPTSQMLRKVLADVPRQEFTDT